MSDQKHDEHAPTSAEVLAKMYAEHGPIHGRDYDQAGAFRSAKSESDDEFVDLKMEAAPDDWPDPLPLPDGLPDVDPFEYHLLPERVRPWAIDVVERMQCPADYVGVAITVAMASVIGRKITVRPKLNDSWSVVPNVWAMIIGRPGVLKSPAIEEALKPVKRLVAKAVDAHRAAQSSYKTDSLIAKIRSDAINKAAAAAVSKNSKAVVEVSVNEQDEPILHRYMTNDSTMAALGELLRQNPNGLLVHRDEIVSLLRSLDQEENAEARSFYLTGWNGDSSYTSDRIARGMNLHVEAVCLSLLGSTQPARIMEYVATAVRGGAGDDGMLQRFGLLVWPDVGPDWRNVDRVPDHDAMREVHHVFDRLDGLDYRDLGGVRDTDHDGDECGLPYLRFNKEASDCFNEWREPLERDLRSGTLHPAIESHFAKYRKLIPMLALVHHLANGNKGAVGPESVVVAMAWDKYLRSHARRVYSAATNGEAVAARAIVKRIIKGDLPSSFSSREVWRPKWSLLTDRQTVVDALGLLVDHGLLRQTESKTDGRPKTVYTANPKIIKGAS